MNEDAKVSKIIRAVNKLAMELREDNKSNEARDVFDIACLPSATLVRLHDLLMESK